MVLQLKTNASSVSCTLGGTMHGYVGIVFLLTIYATLVPMDPFVTPAHMSVLNIVHGATQYEITSAKSQYDERMRVLQE